MSVRAKFRCNSITLMRVSRVNPDVAHAFAVDGRAISAVGYSEITAKAEKLGVPAHVSWDQPTVALTPVTADPDASEEDRSFWNATPTGKIEMTISNPDAAETFELGENYYVTFAPAP